jgi:hypothetical protein
MSRDESDIIQYVEIHVPDTTTNRIDGEYHGRRIVSNRSALDGIGCLRRGSRFATHRRVLIRLIGGQKLQGL